MQRFDIAERPVGNGAPVYVIAEIGYNFNTMDEAHASIDAAIDCGVDAVKFQTFRAETITSRKIFFPSEAGSANQFDEFKQYELSHDQHRELFAHANERGVDVFSTPSYFDDVDFLETLDVPVHKLGSDDLTNLPFVEYLGKTGKPIIFSTGMGTLAEVSEAYDTICATGNEKVIILHCVSNYPIEDMSVCNLRAIETLRRNFPTPIGFSDHTTSLTAATAAVALGAAVIERHFTIDKQLDAPDTAFSADPIELTALVTAIREAEQALGDGIKKPAVTEHEMRLQTRKSTIARRAIASGEIISQDDFIVKRPGTGIPPRLAHLLAGRRTSEAIETDDVITWDKLS